MLEFLWNAPIDGSVSPDNARYDESNASINSSTSRRKSIAIPLQCDRSNRFFLPFTFFFFLIIPGLIATRLVNRVSFVHSACSFLLFRSFIVSAPILSPRFNSESFHTNFRIVFGPLISSIYLTRKRCVARSFQNRTVH